MQQNQDGRRFTQTAHQQPVYRFPQNQYTNGWQPQGQFSTPVQQHDPNSADLDQDKTQNKRRHHKRRKILTLWNLFAVIGLITTIVQLIRYVIVPALVFLQTLVGGAV